MERAEVSELFAVCLLDRVFVCAGRVDGVAQFQTGHDKAI